MTAIYQNWDTRKPRTQTETELLIITIAPPLATWTWTRLVARSLTHSTNNLVRLLILDTRLAARRPTIKYRRTHLDNQLARPITDRTIDGSILIKTLNIWFRTQAMAHSDQLTTNRPTFFLLARRKRARSTTHSQIKQPKDNHPLWSLTRLCLFSTWE